VELEELLKRVTTISGEDVYGHIADDRLRVEHLPRSDATWSEVVLFATTCDAYEQLGGFKAVANIANRQAPNLENCTLRELRAALFFEFRRYNHFGYDPDGDAMTYIHALIEEIRRKIQQVDFRNT